MMCEDCIHNVVCYEKEEDRQALKFCSDYFNLTKELEKIKEEMDEPMRDTTGPYGRGYACAMFKCLDILDEHIEELKGENNETCNKC